MRLRVWSTKLAASLLSLLLFSGADAADEARPLITVGSKTFAESHLLAEIAAQLLESEGFPVTRKLGLGGTLIAFEGLKNGAIDLYPEYTGTLTETVLHQPGLSDPDLATALAQQGLHLGVPLGFNNSYAIAMKAQGARSLGITSVSDLARHPELKLAFSLEFLNRGDGWPALQSVYGLPQEPAGIEHALAYLALDSGRIDVTDAYTTDGELRAHELLLLTDDLGFFPRYDAVLLTRAELPEPAARVLTRLDGTIDEDTMQSLNQALGDGQSSVADTARTFLLAQGLIGQNAETGAIDSRSRRILRDTAIHLQLTGSALLLACLVAIPLALVLSRHQRAARTLLYITGLIQTIPSLALLALLIPLVGLGKLPAIIALFLYSLLPIVRNTLTGLFSIDPLYRQVAAGIGLSEREQLMKVELPLAAPMILAGIKTAAVISVGTATLAAFVGAGGLGEPIITGLTLNDHRLILAGAIPAALLAIAVELVFETLERILVPAHLRD
jgi:osmoprotectant transport system permease protein